MSDTGPDDLKRIGAQLDAAQRRQATRPQGTPPSQMGIAFRFATEMVAALVVGGALGWGIDWLFGYFGVHTKPWFLIVMVVLGAAAGIRNVMHAASDINAQVAGSGSQPDVRDERKN